MFDKANKNVKDIHHHNILTKSEWRTLRKTVNNIQLGESHFIASKFECDNKLDCYTCKTIVNMSHCIIHYINVTQIQYDRSCQNITIKIPMHRIRLHSYKF